MQLSYCSRNSLAAPKNVSYSTAWLPFFFSLCRSFVTRTIPHSTYRPWQHVRGSFLAHLCRTGSRASEVIDDQDECGRCVHLKAPVAARLSSGRVAEKKKKEKKKKRAEPSCLIYFKFKPRLNWKSWITLTPLVQDGLPRLKEALFFPFGCV